MNPFDNYIESMLQSGKSMESIADEMTRALNDARKKQEEREKTEREVEAAIDGLLDEVIAAIDTDTFTLRTAAAVATLAFLDEYPDWDKQDMDNCFKNIYNDLRSWMPKTEEADRPQVKRSVVDDIINIIKESAEAAGARDVKIKNVQVSNKSKEDAEAVDRWLRQLGLK